MVREDLTVPCQLVIWPHPVPQISPVKRLCSSLVGQSIFERSDEEVLNQHHNHRLFFISRIVQVDNILKLPIVPVVMVFTKFDKFQRNVRMGIVTGNEMTVDEVNALVKKKVEENLKENCLVPLAKLTGTDTYPHAVVSGKTLQPPNLLGSTQACSGCTVRRTGPESYQNHPTAPCREVRAARK
jgi:hypothetical protein